jgi:hypothetical protein
MLFHTRELCKSMQNTGPESCLLRPVIKFSDRIAYFKTDTVASILILTNSITHYDDDEDDDDDDDNDKSDGGR